MLNRHSRNMALVMACACVAACDADDALEGPSAEFEQSSDPAVDRGDGPVDGAGDGVVGAAAHVGEIVQWDWSRVPIPLDRGRDQLQAAAAVPVFGPWELEQFHFATPDFIALTQEPGNLFAPFPAAVEPLPPELSAGFFLGFKFYDDADTMVGFGSEQEVLDFENAVGETTYTLTLPERGTLMLSHEEEFAYLFEEINDMIANQEMVRIYDPPLIKIHTVPGSGRLVGGTGEFRHTFGVWREISIINKLDLQTGIQEVGIILQIVHN